MQSKSTPLPASADFRPACSLRHRLLASAASMLLIGASGAPIWAADGDGGVASDGTPGGSASFTGEGIRGATASSGVVSGSGGGAGVQGGVGGWGYPLNRGGTPGRGGYSAGDNGDEGGGAQGTGSANGGGGGGAHGFVGTMGDLDILSVNGIYGGDGGNGGEVNPINNSLPGGGGGGGFGGVIFGLTGGNSGTSIAFEGGDGGNYGPGHGVAGGGNGGTGMVLYQPTGDNVITFTSSATLTGGDGGDGTYRAGDGASGLVLRDGTGNNTLNLDNTIRGGSSVTFGAPALVGTGGHGIAVINMVGNTTLNISGYVKGGDGGEGSGAGGNGITGADLTVTLTGGAQVIGGNNGFGGQAAAIAFTGGTNALTLDATDGGTPTLGGAITHAGAGDSLTLTGSGSGSLDSSLISGFGSFVKSGSSTWTLTGGPVNSVGSWTITGGTLSVSSNVFGASSPLSFSNATLATTGSFLLSEPLQFQGSSGISAAAGTELILAGTLSGSGTFTKSGDGAVVLSGDGDGFAGDMVLSAGTFELNGSSRMGAVSSWTLSGGSLDISENDSGMALQSLSGASSQSNISLGSNDLTLVETEASLYAGTFSGTGSLTKDGAGALTLTGDSSLTGTTYINEGILQFGNGGSTGSVAGAIYIDGGTLAINRSDDFTLTNAISGPGSVLLEGSGTVTFGQTFAGGVSALGGGIQLSGDTLSTASAILGSGARLSGTGSVGSLTVLSSGIVGPGNSTGTIAVNGPLTFTSGSIYQVDATSTGHSDLIAASGTVSLSSGSTVQVVAAAGSYAANTTYTILASDNDISGAFGSVSSNFAFLDASLSYDPKNVFLTLTYTGTDLASLAQTANHAATANAAQALGFGNQVFDTLLPLAAEAVPGAFDALSGEAYASANTVLQQQSIYLRSAVDDRLRQGLTGQGSGATGTSAGVPGNDLSPMFWMQAYGGSGDTASDGNAARIDNTVGGLLLGADLALDADVRAGMFGGFSQSTFDADDLGSSGAIDSYNLGLYAGGQFGALGVRGGAAYAWNDVSMSRDVAYPGLSQSNDSSYTANTAQVFGEVGYQMGTGAFQFEPLAGLAYMHVDGADFSETGGASALSGSTSSMDTVYSTLGLRISSAVQLGGRDLTSHATIGWQHAFGDITPESTAAFAGGSSPFTVAGPPIAENTLPLQAGITFALSDTAQLDASYLGQFADDAMQNAFTLQFAMKF